MATCPALADPDKTTWNFCPNIAAAYLFAVLFGLTMCAHIAQAIIYRKGYSWVIIVSCLMQFANYIFRILSIKNPNVEGYGIGWFILILIAPLWTNAYIYMVVGRMVYNFTTRARIAGIKAWRFGLYFVVLDIVFVLYLDVRMFRGGLLACRAFLIQLAGASSAAGNNKPRDEVLRGVHIYMGGIGFQQLFIFLFVFITVKFHGELLKQSRTQRIQQALLLLYVVYVALFLITVRIIFRLVEYSSGIDSSIPNHEAFQYCFDSLPMLIALVLFNLIHPGKVMPGKEGDFPSRQARKNFNRDGPTNGDAELLPSKYQQIALAVPADKR